MSLAAIFPEQVRRDSLLQISILNDSALFRNPVVTGTALLAKKNRPVHGIRGTLQMHSYLGKKSSVFPDSPLASLSPSLVPE